MPAEQNSSTDQEAEYCCTLLQNMRELAVLCSLAMLCLLEVSFCSSGAKQGYWKDQWRGPGCASYRITCTSCQGRYATAIKYRDLTKYSQHPSSTSTVQAADADTNSWVQAIQTHRHNTAPPQHTAGTARHRAEHTGVTTAGLCTASLTFYGPSITPPRQPPPQPACSSCATWRGRRARAPRCARPPTPLARQPPLLAARASGPAPSLCGMCRAV